MQIQSNASSKKINSIIGEGQVKVSGKFLAINNRRFIVKGVTYGTFEPNADYGQFPTKEVMDLDFKQMVQNGINTIRTYTIPPIALLDLAQGHGLKVMVGLPWAQHIAFLENKETRRQIVESITHGIKCCNNHPAIFCYSIGNEIPASIIRWYGKRKSEQFLKELYFTAKQAAPDALITYVNFPTTEYLDLPFLDFYCYNVYLESKKALKKYLLRLQNLSGEKPLIMAEIGLDSLRNGEDIQAEILNWQLNTIFEQGCAGLFVFAWTDTWWRGGFPIIDWDFGLVTRSRIPKLALPAVAQIFNHEIPNLKGGELFISVVVCSYNGAATIRDTMEGLKRMAYRSFEVIVVNDGSSDATPEIVSEYPVILINQTNQGLSAARNRGLQEAKGEIVAYIDDDAYPDVFWLAYLAVAFNATSHAGIGGPNIAPGYDGRIANCIALSPGGPVHVLIDDEVAEHIPGCNMAFRREVLLEIGGFDPIFRSAGDDVDLCWRIQHTGRTIGYHPAAFVWHHRRNSFKAYWRQQKGYGKAEALLEQKWPSKYNAFGHLTWSGRIYGNGLTRPLQIKNEKVFHGTWGTALFQSVYQKNPHYIACLPLMPEWYLLVGFFLLLSLMSVYWPALIFALPLFFVSWFLILLQAGISAFNAVRYSPLVSQQAWVSYWSLVTIMHIVQPMARLVGRIKHGLSPWRKSGSRLLKITLRPAIVRKMWLWSEAWRAPEDWLADLEAELLQGKARVRRGDVHDTWDLSVAGGFFTSIRSKMAIEEHGSNRQLVRLKSWLHISIDGWVLLITSFIFTTLGIYSYLFVLSIVSAAISLGVLSSILLDAARAMNETRLAFNNISRPGSIPADSAKTENTRQVALN